MADDLKHQIADAAPDAEGEAKPGFYRVVVGP